MEALILWAAFEAAIALQQYPCSGRRGEQPIGLAKHLRIDLVQQRFNLSDPMLEDAFHEIDSMRRFPGLELSEDRIPDETTICKFRDQLEAYDSASIPRV